MSYAELRGVVQQAPLTAYSARDNFSTGGGSNLNGQTLPVGGTWTTSGGDAGDFLIQGGSNLVVRTDTLDAAFVGTTSNVARLALAGATNYTNIVTQVDVGHTGAITPLTSSQSHIVARYVDTNNWLYVSLLLTNAHVYTVVRVRVAGGENEPVYTTLPGLGDGDTGLANPAMLTVRMMTLASGHMHLWAFPHNSTPTTQPQLSWWDSALATGGALASGRVGFGDTYHTSSTAKTRLYDNFAAWVPTLDASVFGSQSLEIRHDRAIREDSAGTFWPNVSRVDGDHLLVPPAGREARPVKMLVKGSRVDVVDPGIDDIRATLSVTPRYLAIPEG